MGDSGTGIPSDPEPLGPRFRQLKPRPGRAGEEVSAHQRGRIHAATIELVDEVGYAGLTVTGIARAAGVSTHTFYENFRDKEECFLATYDLIVREAAREILTARNREREWRAKLEAGFLAFTREVATSPKAARLALVEALAAGKAARERMHHTNGLFEALVRESFADGEGRATMPPLIVKGIVAGGTRVARARLLGKKEEQLMSEAAALFDWALSFFDPAAQELPPERGVAPTPPPGRVRPLATVFADRREEDEEATMILDAAARVAAAEGYGALTVPRICREAGVTRRRFQARFADVSACFFAALQLMTEELVRRLSGARQDDQDWPESVHRAFVFACELLAADPTFVRLAFHELPATGGDGSRWRVRLISELSSLLRNSAPVDQAPTELEAEASIGAVWAVLSHYAVRNRARELPRMAPTLSYLALAPAIGARQALDAPGKVSARFLPSAIRK